MNDTTRYRTRLVEAQANRWLGKQNCEEVFAFLGWEHPDNELDHSAIHGIGNDETAYPGDWIVRAGPAEDEFVYTDEQFHAEFESASDNKPIIFAWGQGTDTDLTTGNIEIPIKRDGSQIGYVRLSPDETVSLWRMLTAEVNDVR